MPRRYDGTVRNAMGEVIQFLYGEDGMEGTAIEGQRVEFLRWGRRKFEEAYRYHLDNPGVSDQGRGERGGGGAEGGKREKGVREGSRE